jgi:phosphohistidine phosphatase
MDLILWRHAEAIEAADGGDDLQRALTPKGERQAKRMAAWLNRHLSAGTRVLVSPALRTRQTADALGRDFRVVPALAPEAEPQALLHAAHWPGARSPALIVGHQPTLGMTAALLLTGTPDPWPLRKGALIWLRHRHRDGEAQAVLHALIGPDLA